MTDIKTEIYIKCIDMTGDNDFAYEIFEMVDNICEDNSDRLKRFHNEYQETIKFMQNKSNKMVMEIAQLDKERKDHAKIIKY